MSTLGRTVKEQIVAEVTNRLKERSNFIVANVSRLPAAEADSLRRQLRAADARLFVLSQRLGARSLEGLKLPGADLFEGSLGLVVPSDDVASTAKLIVEFSKGHEERVVIRGAWLDGEVVDRKRVEQLASLPPKPVLRAQVVAAIEGPLALVIGLLEELIGGVAWALEQAAAKAPSPETPQPAQEPPQPDAQQHEGGPA